MAKTTASAQYAAQVKAKGNFSEAIDDMRQTGGAVQFAALKVDIVTDNVATDVIDLVELPEGAIVLPELSKIVVTAAMTSGAMTCHVGDADDDDRYGISVNTAVRGVIPFIAANATAFPAGLATRHKARGATTTVQLKLATYAATKSDGSMTVILAYTCL